MKTVCAYCGTIIRPGDTPDDPVSHGICKPCKENAIATLGIDISKYLDMLDAPVVFVDDDARVLAINHHALQFVDKPAGACENRSFGKVFECTHARRPEGCGHSIHCSGCVIRAMVEETARTGTPVNCRPAVLNQDTPAGARPVSLVISAKKEGDVILLKVEPAECSSHDTSR